MQCLNCHKDIPENALVCPYCGSPVVAVPLSASRRDDQPLGPVTVSATTMSDITVDPDATLTVSSAKSPVTRKPWFMPVIVLVVAALVVAIVLGVSQSGRSTADIAETETPTPTPSVNQIEQAAHQTVESDLKSTIATVKSAIESNGGQTDGITATSCEGNTQSSGVGSITVGADVTPYQCSAGVTIDIMFTEGNTFVIVATSVSINTNYIYNSNSGLFRQERK